jgi:hypothetical protein
MQMKKITLLLVLILIKISACAQEGKIADIQKNYDVFTIEQTPDILKTNDFSFASVLFKPGYNKNFTDLYLQESEKYPPGNFSLTKVEKHPLSYLINTYSDTANDYTNGFSLGKWNNNKGFELNISLGGKCGL